jgi:hypothetical protein
MNTRMIIARVGAASMLIAIPLVSLAFAGGQPEERAPIKTGQPGAETDRKARLAQPGPEHRMLEPLLGSWTISGQCWEKQGESPQSVTGTDDSEWVLGNRFVKCHVKGSKAGKQFEGIGMMGYDNAQRQYQASWQDTECTAIKMETGTYDSATKTFTFTGDFKDENGQSVRCRRLVKIDSDDQHTMTAYLTPGGQTEMKVAELTFKRTAAKATPKR